MLVFETIGVITPFFILFYFWFQGFYVKILNSRKKEGHEIYNGSRNLSAAVPVLVLVPVFAAVRVSFLCFCTYISTLAPFPPFSPFESLSFFVSSTFFFSFLNLLLPGDTVSIFLCHVTTARCALQTGASRCVDVPKNFYVYIFKKKKKQMIDEEGKRLIIDDY